MKRYYYDDPLGAIWMMRRFGFFIIIQDTIFIHNDWRELADKCSDEAWVEGRKFYIHPDNEYILKPQKGDLVKDIDNEYQIVWEDHIGLGIDTSVGTQSPEGCKIIQRNGIPFMWPKEETVE